MTAQEDGLRQVERRAGIKFERIGAPQPNDIVNASSRDATQSLEGVSDEILGHFEKAAEVRKQSLCNLYLYSHPKQELIQERGAVKALCAALAVISGTTDIASRSLLSSAEGFVTLHMEFKEPVRTKGYIWTLIRKAFPENVRLFSSVYLKPVLSLFAP